MSRKNKIGVFAALALAGCVFGDGMTFDFETEDDFVTPLLNGQFINTFGANSEFGNVFTVTHVNGPGDGLVIFDTTPNVNPFDPDLWVNTGNAIAVQEEADGFDKMTGDFYDNPNDDAGDNEVLFEFLAPTELCSIDLIDINGNGPARVILTDGGGLTRTYEVPMFWTGDVSAGAPGIGTLLLTTLDDQVGYQSTATGMEMAGFDASSVMSMSVTLFGSGAIDNMSLVPAPGAAVLLLGALAGRRRRRH